MEELAANVLPEFNWEISVNYYDLMNFGGAPAAPRGCAAEVSKSEGMCIHQAVSLCGLWERLGLDTSRSELNLRDFER